MKKLYKLYVFDVEGTLVEPISGGPFRKKPEDWEWLPGRRVVIDALLQSGASIALASNQGGVAYGLLDKEALHEELHKVAYRLKADLQVCYHHPDGNIPELSKVCTCRKPEPGMIVAAMNHVHVRPEDTLCVGDRPEDKKAAFIAGCDYEHAEQFFDTRLYPNASAGKILTVKKTIRQLLDLPMDADVYIVMGNALTAVVPDFDLDDSDEFP